MKYAVTFLLFIVFGLLLKVGLFLGIPHGDLSEEVIFTIKPGANLRNISERLRNDDLISSSINFHIYAKLMGQSQKIKVGEYKLNSGMRPSKILDILTLGKSIQYQVTIPEGYNMYEVAKIFEEKGFFKSSEFLKHCRDRSWIKTLLGKGHETLEGYLFPDTYSFSKFESIKKIINLMVNKHKSAIKGIKHPGLTSHELVTLASIIEKETGAPEERPLISSVFHNRLKKSMRLQTDPTVLYGILDRTKKMKKNITKKDLQTRTRYNTYKFKGLPFGPIANPGREALQAAARPVASRYLYFVSRNNGTHVFSENYEAHAKAVRTFQLNRKMRQGKSWRDLNKRQKGAHL